MIQSVPYFAAPEAIRQQAFNDGIGVKGETYPRLNGASSSIMVSGTIYVNAIGFAAGDVVTNICTDVATLGSGSTGVGMKLGVYTKAGGRLAVTGDVSAAHGSTGPKVNALSAPYTIPTTDVYYIAAIWIGGTPVTLLRALVGAAYAVAFGAATAAFGVQVTQTDLIDPITVNPNTASAIAYWFGWS